MQAAAEGQEQPSTSSQAAQPPARPGLQFSDRDEHLYFWFPLLAGLSELTFEPQPDIRNGALGVSLTPLCQTGRRTLGDSVAARPSCSHLAPVPLCPVHTHALGLHHHPIHRHSHWGSTLLSTATSC